MQLLDMMQVHVNYLSTLMQHCNINRIDYEKELTFLVVLRECKKLKARLDGHNVDTSAFDFLKIFPPTMTTCQNLVYRKYRADLLAEKLL
jgi:hypothetical protein